MKAGDDDCKTVVPGTHRGHRRRIGGVLGLSDSFVGRGDANSARRAADGAQRREIVARGKPDRRQRLSLRRPLRARTRAGKIDGR